MKSIINIPKQYLILGLFGITSMAISIVKVINQCVQLMFILIVSIKMKIIAQDTIIEMAALIQMKVCYSGT